MVGFDLTFKQIIRLVEDGQYSLEDFEKKLKDFKEPEKDEYILDLLKESLNEDLDDDLEDEGDDGDSNELEY